MSEAFSYFVVIGGAWLGLAILLNTFSGYPFIAARRELDVRERKMDDEIRRLKDEREVEAYRKSNYSSADLHIDIVFNTARRFIVTFRAGDLVRVNPGALEFIRDHMPYMGMQHLVSMKNQVVLTKSVDEQTIGVVLQVQKSEGIDAPNFIGDVNLLLVDIPGQGQVWSSPICWRHLD